MSKGTYCSASQRIDSDSSSGDIAGRLIFFTITEWPETEVPKSWLRTFRAETRRLTMSTTSEASMMAPSTIASGERVSSPDLTRRYPPPLASFSSTSVRAEEPMSRPTRFLDFRNSTLTPHRKISYGSGFYLGIFRLGWKIAESFSPVKVYAARRGFREPRSQPKVDGETASSLDFCLWTLVEAL